MKFKHVTISFIAIVLLFVVCTAGGVLYLYNNPEVVVSLIENSIQKYYNISLSFNQVSYSLSPLRLQAEGIHIQPKGGSRGFDIKIPKMTANLSRTGVFGRKSLVVDYVELSEFSVAYDAARFRLISKPSPPESVIGSLLRSAVTIFLFRDIRFDAVNLNKGNLTADLNGATLTARNISANRSTDQQIEIVSAARLQWSSKSYDIDIPDLKLFTSGRVSFSEHSLEAKISANNAVFHGPLTNVHEIDLEAEGSFNPATRRVEIPVLELIIGEDFRLEGALDMSGGDSNRQTSFRIRKAVFLPETLLEKTPERFRDNLPPLEVHEEIFAGGFVNLAHNGDAFTWNYTLDLHFKQNPFNYTTVNRKIMGRAAGLVTLHGNSTDINVDAELKFKDSEFKEPRFRAAISQAELSVSGSYPYFQIKRTSATISRLMLPQWNGNLPFENIKVQINGGGIDLDGKVVKLPEVQVEWPTLGVLAGMVEADRDKVRVRLEKQDVRLLSVINDLKLIPAGWEAKGQQSLSVDATWNLANRLSFDSNIFLKELAIQDPNARLMGDNLSSEIKLKGAWDLKSASILGKYTVDVKDGEFLYDLFYVDLRKNPLTAETDFAYDLDEERIDFKDFNLKLKNTLSLISSGGIHLGQNRRARLKVHMPAGRLFPLYRFLVVEPFQATQPLFADMNVSGKVSADFDISGTEGEWQFKGHCRWEDGELTVQNSGIAIKKININYPLWYSSKVTKNTVRPLNGKVLMGSVRFPPLPEQPVRFAIEAKPNGLTVSGPTRINVFGGTVAIGPLSAKDLFSSKRSIVTHLMIDETDIAPILSGIWPNPVSGRIAGRIDPVSIKGNRIAGKGEISIKAFNGRISLSDLFVERLFSTSPLMGLNAEFEGIHLGRLTEGTQFGNIRGILRGHLKNLTISYGQPQQFDLFVETVRARNVKQEISVQAIENISRIGSGQSPFAGLSGIFTSLFETLRYDKIGIRASLKNDIFKVNGTIHEDGKEYLMKGGAISGVNIINQNPNNRISFKDMIKRINRVTEGNKPVIN